MRIEWKSEWPFWVILIGMLALAVLAWPTAPDRIPVHWSLSGQIDRYGGRFEGLFAIPLLALGLYGLMLVVPRVDPGRANYEGFRGPYNTIRLALTVLMAVLYSLIHLSIRRPELRVATVMPMMLGGFFVVLGNLLGKLRPNWFCGIRTPWTLSSKRSWVRTHRLGGWLMICFGLAMIPAGVLGRTWGFAVLTVGLIALVGVTTVYSYLVWKHDPDRIAPAGTQPAGEGNGPRS